MDAEELLRFRGSCSSLIDSKSLKTVVQIPVSFVRTSHLFGLQHRACANVNLVIYFEAIQNAAFVGCAIRRAGSAAPTRTLRASTPWSPKMSRKSLRPFLKKPIGWASRLCASSTVEESECSDKSCA